MSYDFSNFIMQAAIYPPGEDGTPVPLWSNNQWQDAALSLAVLSELVVEIGLGMIPKMTATLQFNYLEGLQFLNTAIVVQGQSLLSAQFGYATGSNVTLSPPYTAVILEPDVTMSISETSITLVAMGVNPGRNRRGRAFSGEYTREEFLRKLMPDAEFDFSEVREENGEAAKLLKDTISFGDGWGTEWYNLLRVVRDAQCWLTVGQKPEASSSNAFTQLKASTHKDVIRIFPISRRIGAQPRYAFQMFPSSGNVLTAGGAKAAGVGPGTGVFPILGFNRPSNALFLPNAVCGLVHKGIDDATGLPYTKIYKDKDTEGGVPNPNLGASDALGVKNDARNPEGDETTGDGFEPHHADQPDKGTKDKAHAEVKEQAWRVGIPIEVDTLGIPDLLPGEVIKIQGFGKRYDGNYVVGEITHTLGSGGFSTRFKGWTNTSENGAVLDEAGLDALRKHGAVNQLEIKAAEETDSVTQTPSTNAGS